jgi:hypothetical protein
MESILASTEDHLLSNLSFKIPQNGASYVQSKDQSTFFPQGGNVYSPTTGQRILRFALASDGYMDLSSLAFSFDLTNTWADEMSPLIPGTHSLFSRVRVLISGTEVENIEYYNVASEMFNRLLPYEKKANTAAMGFAGYTIPAGTTKNLIHMPKVLGMCNQPLWVPGSFLGHQGIIFELHLSEGVEVFQSGATQSTSYSLSNCRALCDVYQLDSQLHNTYAQHVLSGKPLVFKINSLVNTQFQLQSATPSFDLSVSRSFSRLNSIFVTMHGATSTTVRDITTFIAANAEE